MRIALVARSINPLAPQADPGFGAEAARVTSLGQALAGLDHRVTIYARRNSRGLPDSTIIAPGVTVEYLTAGPPDALDTDQLAPHLPEFGHRLAQRWRRNPPSIAHAYQPASRRIIMPSAPALAQAGTRNWANVLPGAGPGRPRATAHELDKADGSA